MKTRRPRMLLLSYHFPPSRSAGAARWGGFSRFFAEAGWEIHVIAAPPTDGGLYVPSSGEGYTHAESGARVHVAEDGEHPVNAALGASARFLKFIRRLRSPIDEKSEGTSGSAEVEQSVVRRNALPRLSFSRSSMSAALRSWLFHAVMRPWANNAELVGRRLVSTKEFDVVVATCPPYLAAEAARRIAAFARVPYVLDYRDPWSVIDALPADFASPIWYNLAQRYEKRAVQNAAAIMMNTDHATSAMRAAYPGKNIITVRNGYDGTPVVATNSRNVFNIAYAGSLYLDRDPRPLLSGVRRLVQSHSFSPETLRIQFIGTAAHRFANQSVMALAAEHKMEEYVDLIPTLDKQDLAALLSNASVLINFQQSTRLCIPSKIYEYAHFPASMLAIEHRDSATWRLLEQTSAALAEPHDTEGIYGALVRFAELFRASQVPAPIAYEGDFGMSTQSERALNLITEQIQR